MAGDWKNGTILGAVAGLLAVTPQISSWIRDALNKAIPSSWMILGNDWTIPIAFVSVIWHKH